MLSLVPPLRKLLDLVEKWLLWKKSQHYTLDHVWLNFPAHYSHWMNLGTWTAVNSSTGFVSACEGLAKRLADAVALKRGENVVDVGFGCGDQDFYFLEKYGVKRIVGFTASKEQVEMARTECARRKESRFEPNFGAAPYLPLAQCPDTDVIFSLDSAYHYNTREQFIEQCARHLKPGGRVGLADLILNEPSPLQYLLIVPFAMMMGMPLRNLYGTKRYIEIMQKYGFQDVSIDVVDPIAFSTLPSFISAQLARYGPVLNPSIVNKYGMIAKVMSLFAEKRLFQVVVVSARKG